MLEVYIKTMPPNFFFFWFQNAEMSYICCTYVKGLQYERVVKAFYSITESAEVQACIKVYFMLVVYIKTRL